MLLAYYNGWQGQEFTLIERIGMTDSEIIKHLKTDIIQDRMSPILSVGIKDLPNEEGFFMLWELSVSDEGFCAQTNGREADYGAISGCKF